MEQKLSICEGCQYIVSILLNNKPTFICPICGCINKRKLPKEYIGNVYVVGPEINCSVTEEENENITFLNDFDEEENNALMTLLDYGWKIKFKATKKIIPLDDDKNSE
jgi:predicted RNA-binding Zn-ribbon protein involved in translation (DUF1610 family)